MLDTAYLGLAEGLHGQLPHVKDHILLADREGMPAKTSLQEHQVFCYEDLLHRSTEACHVRVSAVHTSQQAHLVDCMLHIQRRCILLPAADKPGQWYECVTAWAHGKAHPHTVNSKHHVQSLLQT